MRFLRKLAGWAKQCAMVPYRIAEDHPTRTLTSVSSLALFGLTLWGLIGDKDTAWWASTGQWVGGVGSIAAAGTAVWIARAGWSKSDEQAAEQARRFDELQARELASKFAIWVNHLNKDRFSMSYHNASALPVYGVQIKAIILANVRESTFTLGDLGPTAGAETLEEHSLSINKMIDMVIINKYPDSISIDAAGQRTEKPRARFYRASLIRGAQIRVQFYDGNGNPWTREPNGSLVPFALLDQDHAEFVRQFEIDIREDEGEGDPQSP